MSSLTAKYTLDRARAYRGRLSRGQPKRESTTTLPVLLLLLLFYGIIRNNGPHTCLPVCACDLCREPFSDGSSITVYLRVDIESSSYCRTTYNI